VLFSHFFYFRSCTWIPVVALRVVLYDTMHSAQSQPRCFSKSHHLSSQSTPGPAPCVGVSPGRAHCCPSIITIRRCGPYHIPTCCEMTRTTTIWSNSTLRTRARSATSMRSNVGERPEAVLPLGDGCAHAVEGPPRLFQSDQWMLCVAPEGTHRGQACTHEQGYLLAPLGC